MAAVVAPRTTAASSRTPLPPYLTPWRQVGVGRARLDGGVGSLRRWYCRRLVIKVWGAASHGGSTRGSVAPAAASGGRARRSCVLPLSHPFLAAAVGSCFSVVFSYVRLRRWSDPSAWWGSGPGGTGVDGRRCWRGWVGSGGGWVGRPPAGGVTCIDSSPARGPPRPTPVEEVNKAMMSDCRRRCRASSLFYFFFLLLCGSTGVAPSDMYATFHIPTPTRRVKYAAARGVCGVLGRRLRRGNWSRKRAGGRGVFRSQGHEGGQEKG